MAETEKRKGRYYKLPVSLLAKIDAESKTSGLRKEAVVEKAIQTYFKRKRK